MITALASFLFACMAGALLTLVVRNRAVRYGWYDQAKSSRNIHSRPVPRLGGIAIVAGFFAPLTALLFIETGVGRIYIQHTDLIVGLFGGGLAIALLGLWDDLRGIGAKEKFAVQFLVAGGLYFLGFRIEEIATPFGYTLSLGWLALPFTLLWIVGIVNAMNLIDGLDGLAGGVAFFAVATNFVLAAARGDVLLTLMMAALAGAIVGFLIFNFNPASIFMGDTGSMFLGFVLAAVSIKTSSKNNTAVAMLVPVIALGLPIMDTLLAMIRRTILGRPMFCADREHIHHRLMSRLGATHRRAVIVLYALCCFFALTALGLAYANGPQTAMLLTGLAGVVFILMRKLGYLNVERTADAIETRKRNLELRSQAQEIVSRIRAAQTPHDIWSAVRPTAELLSVAHFELRVERIIDGALDGMTFEVRRSTGTALPLVCRMDVRSRTERLGQITAVWRDGRYEINRDEELALTAVAAAVGDAANRALATEPPRDLRLAISR